MSTERDPIEVAAEVAGTPEQVWELIATGPGISTWFMPAEVQEREGGAIVQRHAPGDERLSHGTIAAYEPPRRFVYEERFGETTMATEFLVEAQAGGTCVVRIVTHGLTAADDEMTGSIVAGWTQALATLRVRLASFAGLPAASARVWSTSEETLDAAWAAFTAVLGLDGARAGDVVDGADGAHPAFRGTVELVQRHGVLLRTDAPRPGVLSFAGTGFGGRTSIVVDRYVYAPDADAAAAAEHAAWTAFLSA